MRNGCRVFLLKSNIQKQGGLEKYTKRIASAFSAKACDVTILTTGDIPKNWDSNRFTFQQFAHTTSLSYKKIKAFDTFCNDKIAAKKPDIVFGLDRNSFQTHLRAGNGVHAAYLLRRKEMDPFLKRLTYPFNPLHQLLLKLEKTAFEHPKLEKLFTNSHMVRDEILRFYATDPKKIEVVHNGVEWNEMAPHFNAWKSSKSPFCKELNLDPSSYHFLFIGHEYKRKGLAPLLRGLSLIKDRNIHLSVVGKERNIATFQKMCANLGIADKVSFFGQRFDTHKFLTIADSLVVPSFYDPFANVTVEALAMGVFVISSKSNGGSEVLTEQNGNLIEFLLSPDAMKASLLRAMQTPKTAESATTIRNSVKHLDFSNQLPKLLNPCLLTDISSQET